MAWVATPGFRLEEFTALSSSLVLSWEDHGPNVNVKFSPPPNHHNWFGVELSRSDPY